MRRFFLNIFFLCGVLMLSMAATQSADAKKARKALTILHTNDTHSHIDPERGGVEAGKGGAVERAAFIDSVRAADGRRNVLLLDAGDFEQGSSYFTLLGGRVEMQTMNAMRYDAACLGNHEFDNGIDDLTRRVKLLDFDILCANYDFSEFELGKYVKPYAIYKRGGLKVGVIGLLCDVRSVIPTETASRLTFLSPSETVNKWAEYLRNEKKCDLVIVLSHLGYGNPAGAKPATAVPAAAAPAPAPASASATPASDASDRVGGKPAALPPLAYDSGRVGGKPAAMPPLVFSADRDDCGLAGMIRNVDIIVGGHSHTNLTSATVVNDLDGKPVMIVQDYRWGLYVGQIDISK